MALYESDYWIDMDIPGYQISNTGLIRRITLKIEHERFPPGIRLLPFRSQQRKKGCWYRLSDDGSQKVFKISDLMWKYFGKRFYPTDAWLEKTRNEINVYNEKLRKGKIKLVMSSRVCGDDCRSSDCPYMLGWIKGTAEGADFKSGCSFTWRK